LLEICKKLRNRLIFKKYLPRLTKWARLKAFRTLFPFLTIEKSCFKEEEN